MRKEAGLMTEEQADIIIKLLVEINEKLDILIRKVGTYA